MSEPSPLPSAYVVALAEIFNEMLQLAPPIARKHYAQLIQRYLGEIERALAAATAPADA